MGAQTVISSVQTLEKLCAWCDEPFTPTRRNQRFGSGPEHRTCRRYWHRAQNKSRPHACPNCGGIHKPRKKRTEPPPRRHVRECAAGCWCHTERLL